MKRIRCAAAVIAASAVLSGGGPPDRLAAQSASAPSHALRDVPAEAAAVLREIKARDKDLMAVSEEDGRFLRVTIASKGTRRALEIGTADGYSAIWIGLALRHTGGRLTTIEYDAAHARSAADNIRRAGLADIVTVVPGDAFQHIPRLEGTFDFVFLDAWKRDYKRFLDMLMPRLETGGLFLGHNVVNKQDEMRDFLDAIQSSAGLMTSIVRPGHEGMSISLKLPPGK